MISMAYIVSAAARELAALWLAVRAALGAKPVQWRGEMLTRVWATVFPNLAKVEFRLYRQPWQAYYTQGGQVGGHLGNAGVARALLKPSPSAGHEDGQRHASMRPMQGVYHAGKQKNRPIGEIDGAIVVSCVCLFPHQR